MPTPPKAAPLAGLALRCQPDSRLVRLSGEAQPRAFEEIVRRYRKPLVSFAAAFVPSDRAEDVVQEALAKAHVALAAGEAVGKLRPWLYTIVRNRALNHLRDEPTHEQLDEDSDGVLQPSEVAARHEELTALVRRLKDLPRAQREALVQRELEGRSHREIGVALGVSAGAVRGLIFRARTALRDGAGMLIPMPVLRALLNAGPLEAEATGTAIGGAAVGLTAGGGGGIAAKAGTTLAVAVLAVGSGVAIHRGGDSGKDSGATAFAGNGDAGADQGAGSQGGSGGPSGVSGHRSGSGAQDGPGGADSSGPGSGDSGGDGGDQGASGDDGADGSGGEGREGPGGGEGERTEGSLSNRSGENESGDEEGGGHEGTGGGESEDEGSGSSGRGGSGDSSGPGGGGSAD